MKRTYRSRSIRRSARKLHGVAMILQTGVLLISYAFARRGLHLPLSMYLVLGVSLLLIVQMIGVAILDKPNKREE